MELNFLQLMKSSLALLFVLWCILKPEFVYTIQRVYICVVDVVVLS